MKAIYRVSSYLPMTGTNAGVKRWLTFGVYATKQGAVSAIARAKRKSEFESRLVWQIEKVKSLYSVSGDVIYTEEV